MDVDAFWSSAGEDSSLALELIELFCAEGSRLVQQGIAV
jgi:hypothetical protein